MAVVRPRASGFTFVELLVAATMMSILWLGLSSHLRGGFIVWQQTTRRTEALQRERVAFERLERDLVNAFIYDPSGQLADVPALAAGSGRLSWTTLEPAGRGQPERVRVVGYECRAQDGQQGLWRSSQSVSEVRAQQAAVPALLLPGCEELTVRFAYQPDGQAGTLRWETDWHRMTDALPGLVEVGVRTGAHTGQRVLRVPAGIVEPFAGSDTPA